jgi:hypothetical protein
MKPRFMATALPMLYQDDAEKACRLVMDCFREAPAAPLLRQPMRADLLKIPCTRIDEERKVIVFDLSSERQHELLEFYEHYLADDVDFFASKPEQNPGLYRFAKIYRGEQRPELEFIHRLIVGPYTMGLSFKDEKGAPAFYDPQMRDIIGKYLVMRAKWQKKEINKVFLGTKMLTLIAEPALNVYTSSVGTGTWDDIKNAIDEVIDAVDGVCGVHCCANFDWSLLMSTKAQIINLDAYRYGETMALYRSALTEFLARGGGVAWGIVPTHDAAILDAESSVTLADKLEHTLDMVVANGIDRNLLIESSWITPSCDIASLSTERGERVYKLTREVSEIMRAKYFK